MALDKKSGSGPSILFLDIETAPDLVWTWGVYEQNAIEVKEHWYVLSFAAKWANGPVIVKGLDDYKGYKPLARDDRKLIREVRELLDQADIVVAHNGADFDIKKLNARFIAHGFAPPSPYKIVDTKREIKRVSAFSSNKLDWLAKQLELGKKIEHEGFPMWRGCMSGNESAWKKMKKYNRHDVLLLHDLYNKLSPWMHQPNATLWGKECVNPSCKSSDIAARGFMRSKTRVYQRFQCNNCGTWSKAVLSEKTPKAVVSPV